MVNQFRLVKGFSNVSLISIYEFQFSFLPSVAGQASPFFLIKKEQLRSIHEYKNIKIKDI